jgi:cell wall-associated NlpC family hydrolase
MSRVIVFVSLAVIAAGFPMSLVVAAGATGAGPSGAAVTSACWSSPALPGLTDAQIDNAMVVAEVAEQSPGGSSLAAQVALMTAYTESSLIDLGSEAGSDSLGLFQQRVSEGWGTAAEEEDSAEATAMFVSALLAVPAWQAMPPWAAAQSVQRSAFSDGSNYEANWEIAGTILTHLDDVAVGACGLTVGGASAFGLPAGYRIPSSADPAEAVAVIYALAQLGKPYVWGGAGPGSFDCSGLTMMAWAAAGVSLGHNTLEQIAEGTAVSDLSTISPGDLVLVPGADGTLAAPGHVGIFLGEGLVESAVDPANGVTVGTWADFTAGGLSGVRHIE